MSARPGPQPPACAVVPARSASRRPRAVPPNRAPSPNRAPRPSFSPSPPAAALPGRAVPADRKARKAPARAATTGPPPFSPAHPLAAGGFLALERKVGCGRNALLPYGLTALPSRIGCLRTKGGVQALAEGVYSFRSRRARLSAGAAVGLI